MKAGIAAVATVTLVVLVIVSELWLVKYVVRLEVARLVETLLRRG